MKVYNLHGTHGGERGRMAGFLSFVPVDQCLKRHEHLHRDWAHQLQGVNTGNWGGFVLIGVGPHRCCTTMTVTGLKPDAPESQGPEGLTSSAVVPTHARLRDSCKPDGRSDSISWVQTHLNSCAAFACWNLFWAPVCGSPSFDFGIVAVTIGRLAHSSERERERDIYQFVRFFVLRV
jgi:hypothetical protein